MALDTTKVINGTYGTVFLGDDEVAEMKSFQAKLEFQKEEIKVAGQMATDTKLMGYSGKGSLSLLDEIKQGKDPRFTLIGKLADPNSEGAERIAIKNVSFDDLTLFDFEVGAVGTCECPFTFTDIECIDLI